MDFEINFFEIVAQFVDIFNGVPDFKFIIWQVMK